MEAVLGGGVSSLPADEMPLLSILICARLTNFLRGLGLADGVGALYSQSSCNLWQCWQVGRLSSHFTFRFLQVKQPSLEREDSLASAAPLLLATVGAPHPISDEAEDIFPCYRRRSENDEERELSQARSERSQRWEDDAGHWRIAG